MELTKENIERTINKYSPSMAASVIESFIKVQTLPLESKIEVLQIELKYLKSIYENNTSDREASI